MKKYISKVAVGLMLAVASSSCSDFLNEDLKSELAPDNTYTSSYGFEVGINGLYAIARSEYNTWGENGAFMHNGACAYEVFQIGTDLAVMGTKDGSIQPFGYMTMTPNTTFVESYWKWAYSLIAAANEVLRYSEINNNWDAPTDKALYQAEARFFRAYAYRLLVYTYGDVPYVENIQEDFRIDFTRTPKEEVLSHIVDDVKFAMENLPDDPDSVEPGKLTSWAAEHLLSEIYLMQGDYENAEICAENVIKSGHFHLMENRFGAKADEPGDVFSDLFVENNQNRTSGNMESIWVMQFEYQTQGGGTNSDDWTRRAWEPKYFEIQGFQLADSLGGRGLSQLVPLEWWIGEDAGFFDETDIRNSEYNIKRHWYYNNPGMPDLYGKLCPITEETWFQTYRLFPALTKFFYGRAEDLQLTGSYRDRMKYRLSETYLYLCEARLMQGDQAGAREAINEVRRRAGASELTSDSQMTVDFLLDERIRELVGEEQRRFTLLRLGKLLERTRKYNTEAGPAMKDYHVLWPIPQSIRDSNTGAEFPQNEGY